VHECIVDPADVPWIESFPDRSKAFFDFFVFKGIFVFLDEICSYERDWEDNNESREHDYVVDVFYCYVSCQIRTLEKGIQRNLEISWHDNLMVHAVFEYWVYFMIDFVVLSAY